MFRKKHASAHFRSLIIDAINGVYNRASIRVLSADEHKPQNDAFTTVYTTVCAPRAAVPYTAACFGHRNVALREVSHAR